jgi:hypothetical protein
MKIFDVEDFIVGEKFIDVGDSIFSTNRLKLIMKIIINEIILLILII